MKTISKTVALLALGAAVSTASVSQTMAFPVGSAGATSAKGATLAVTDVRYGGRGFGHGGYGRGGYGRYGGGYGRRGFGRGYGGYGAGVAGFAAGALIGSALARPAYADGPAPVAVPVAGDAVAYCVSRFRSYNPATGVYLGFDGLYHRCP